MSTTVATVLKVLCTPMAAAGTFMVLMGVGVVPLDADMISVANVFIQPLGIPPKPFLLMLGCGKILGVAKLWGYGPMPKLMAFLGLATSAGCAVYGHYRVGGPIIPPIVTIGVLTTLFIVEGRDKKAESKKE